MADDLGAVLEAPEVIADEVVNEVPEGVAADAVEEVAPVEEVKGDERVMPQWLRTLKTTDPATFRTEKAKFFTERAILESAKDFDVKGTRSWLEEKGGREAVEATFTELQGKAAELDAISQKIQNADPSLVSDLTPEAVTKLGPVMNEQWAKADPAGWGHAMTGILAATLTQENEHGDSVSSVIKDIGIALRYNDTEGVKAAAAKLQQWTNGMITTARSAPQKAQQTQQPDKFAAREQELNTREQQAFNTEMERSVDNFRDPLISKELEAFTKRRPNDSDAKDLATNTVKSQVIDRLKNDAPFQKSLNALWARKDKDGALRLIKSRETAAITEIAPKVGRTIFGNPGSAAAPVARTPAGTPSKADVGFSFVDKAPKPELIDRFRTTDAMIMRGKFILKDGKKVSLEA